MTAKSDETPKSHLTHSQFEQALAYLRLTPDNRSDAYDHLVKGLPMATIAEARQCSYQNIQRVVKRVRDGYAAHLKAQERMSN